jgi:hypothetical protein
MIFLMITPTHPLIVTGGSAPVSSTASNKSWQKRRTSGPCMARTTTSAFSEALVSAGIPARDQQ